MEQKDTCFLIAFLCPHPPQRPSMSSTRFSIKYLEWFQPSCLFWRLTFHQELVLGHAESKRSQQPLPFFHFLLGKTNQMCRALKNMLRGSECSLAAGFKNCILRNTDTTPTIPVQAPSAQVWGREAQETTVETSPCFLLFSRKGGPMVRAWIVTLFLLWGFFIFLVQIKNNPASLRVKMNYKFPRVLVQGYLGKPFPSLLMWENHK